MVEHDPREKRYPWTVSLLALRSPTRRIGDQLTADAHRWLTREFGEQEGPKGQLIWAHGRYGEFHFSSQAMAAYFALRWA